MNRDVNINKIVIEGESYRRTFPFSRGLNIIKGEFYSGKSLLLNLIDYSFGRRKKFKPQVQAELKEYCTKVYMEIDVADKTYTVMRNLWQNTDTVAIFFCNFISKENYAPRIVDLSDYNRFLLESIDIPEFSLLKHKRHSLEKETEKISFRDLMRYTYIDQHDLGTSSFMKSNDNVIKNKNRYLFEIIHQFIEFDEKNLALEIANQISEKEKIKRQIDGLKSYLQELKGLDLEELEQEFENLGTKIEQHKKEKKNIIKTASSQQSYDELIYLKIRERIIEIANKKTNWIEKHKDFQLAIDSKKNLLREYNDELKELKATKEAIEILTINHHPHSCPLCSNILEDFSTSNYTSNSIEDIIKHTNNKISTLSISMSTSIDKVNEMEKAIDLLDEEYRIYANALEEYESKIEAPYIADIELINNIIRRLENEKETVNEKIRLYNKITEKETKIIQIQEKIDKLELERDSFKLEEDKKQETIDLLNQEYQEIMKELHLKIDENSCYIDNKKYLPIYNGASLLEHDSGGILMCMQIAFLAAIMKVSKTNKKFKHPNFLMLDTLGKYLGTTLQATDEEIKENQIMDPVTYEEIYKLLIDLSKQFQVFIVDNIPPKIGEEFVQYTFYHNNLQGLIDKTKNEYTTDF